MLYSISLLIKFSFDTIDYGCGRAKISISCRDELYFNTLSELTGFDITSEEHLVRLLSEYSKKKGELERVAEALAQAEEKGYGIVMPDKSELHLEEPEIVKQANGYGVKLRASAQSIHLIRANIETEINHMFGNEYTDFGIQMLREVPDYHKYSISQNLANVFDTLGDKIVSMGLDSSFKYPFDDFNVLNKINFTINSGETIGIVGPTGSGKSTLIRQLLREFNVTDGEILIDNESIEKYSIDDIRKLVGYVPQEHILFRRSVDDNILIGNPQATHEQIDSAMVVADFKKDLKELSQGEHTLVSELGGSLSGGQRQRLSIARALVKDPEILILDDSLSAVDALTETNIIKQLKETRTDKTNIIVAHCFSSIALADKIIVLQEGRITDIGTHKELLKYDNWYKMQYLIQIKGDNYEEL